MKRAELPQKSEKKTGTTPKKSRKPGRKPLPPEMKRVQTSVSLRQNLRDVVEAVADAQDKSKSDVLQELVSEAIQHRARAHRDGPSTSTPLLSFEQWEKVDEWAKENQHTRARELQDLVVAGLEFRETSASVVEKGYTLSEVEPEFIRNAVREHLRALGWSFLE